MNAFEFNNKNKLYHYTNLDALLKIIESGTLKFGKLPKMNDITEASKEIFLDYNCNNGEPKWENIQIAQNKLMHIGQISLSQDGKRLGFGINSMWGHYADSGEGCCIVFDKDIIIRKCEELRLFYGVVSYDGAVTDVDISENSSVDDFFNDNCNKLFFHKSQDWSSEQEFRIIKNNNLECKEDGLPIGDAIIAVIFHINCKCRVFECPRKQKYLMKLGNISALEYICSNMWGDCNGVKLMDCNDTDWLDTSKWELDDTNRI